MDYSSLPDRWAQGWPRQRRRSRAARCIDVGRYYRPVLLQLEGRDLLSVPVLGFSATAPTVLDSIGTVALTVNLSVRLHPRLRQRPSLARLQCGRCSPAIRLLHRRQRIGDADDVSRGIANIQMTLNGVTYGHTAFNDGDWTRLVLASDNLGALQDSKNASITVH